MMMHKNEQIYLDWFNQYLTVSCMASRLGMHENKLWKVLAKGRALHYSRFGSVI